MSVETESSPFVAAASQEALKINHVLLGFILIPTPTTPKDSKRWLFGKNK